MKVFLDSVGCRLNQSEIEKIGAQFRLSGHTLVGNASEADLIVINTCTVTSRAAADSRQKIRKYERVGEARMLVTGCWATMEPDPASALPAVTRVVPNLQKHRLVIDELGLPLEHIEMIDEPREPLPGKQARTRAFVKVQDGCDNFCTFCITRLARGPARSVTIDEVLLDINNAIMGGVKEVVLSGINLSSWGKDLEKHLQLKNLVDAILADTDLQRLRFSSLEPWGLDRSFFSLFSDPRICRHLHLPLQSGSAKIMKRMGRQGTPESFARLVEMARTVSPDIAITTDIMTGFPGEGEMEFGESLSFVNKLVFAGGHVFTYSPRNGTPAAEFTEQVPRQAAKWRSRKMREVLAEQSKRYRNSFIGNELVVLWETFEKNAGGWRMQGLSDNYIRVQSISTDRKWNELSAVQLDREIPEGLFGDIID